MDEMQRNKQKKCHRKKRARSPSDASSSESDEWVEKRPSVTNASTSRDDWMSLGTLKTFTKDDIRSRREPKEKKNIDSYNPATSSIELNPYWKNGGTGVPQTSEEFRKSNPFLKPKDDDNYYTKTGTRSNCTKYKKSSHGSSNRSDYKRTDDAYGKNYNWKKKDDYSLEYETVVYKETIDKIKHETRQQDNDVANSMCLSDEKMNKLAAKIVKAEILGDANLVKELKAKLDAAKDFKKRYADNSKVGDDKEALLLIQTTPSGSSRPVAEYNDKINNKGKIKTHDSKERVNYYANDEKYDIARMFEQEKYSSNHKNDVQFAMAVTKCKEPDTLEDLFEERISQNRRAIKETKLDDKYAIRQNLKLDRSQEHCKFCFESKNMIKHLVISCGEKVYVSLPSKKSLVDGQCLISTIHHHQCVTSVDEDVWEEIMSYRKIITQFFDKQNRDVIFFETAIKLFRFPHMVINCVPVPRDVGDTASIYFKKALLECETEWSMNKKVIELKGKNVRKRVPKGLPYFWVDFGMDPGFAHVVEDQHDFPETFGSQIIAGMLDLDHRLWKNPQGEYGEVQRKKVSSFLKEWKPFEAMFRSDGKR